MSIDINQLVDALMELPTINVPQNRNDLINELPTYIRGNISRRPEAKNDIRNTIKTCLNYENGLNDFMNRLREYEEPQSLLFQKVEEIVRGEISRDVFYTAYADEDLNVLDSDIKISEIMNNYHLCLIANNKYLYTGRLQYPFSDAENLRETLHSFYHFEDSFTSFVKDATREDMFKVFQKYADLLTPDDNLLLFFAGHGEWDEENQLGYWVPVDAKTDNFANWVSVNDIKDFLKRLKAKHVLIISDCCFSGGLFREFGGENLLTRLPSRIYKLPSRKAITSSTLNKVLDHSMFNKTLIKRLKENQMPALDAMTLFVSMREAVVNNTDNLPQYGVIHGANDEGGDFVFLRK